MTTKTPDGLEGEGHVENTKYDPSTAERLVSGQRVRLVPWRNSPHKNRREGKIITDPPPGRMMYRVRRKDGVEVDLSRDELEPLPHLTEVTIETTEDELHYWKTRAAQAGMGLDEWVRKSLNDHIENLNDI